MPRIFPKITSRSQLAIVAGDLLVFLASLLLGYVFAVPKEVWPHFSDFITHHALAIFIIGVSYLLVLYVADLYDKYLDYRHRENISKIIFSTLTAVILLFCLSRLLPRIFIGRTFLEWQGLAFMWTLLLWRYFFSSISLPRFLRRKAVILGAGEQGQWIAKTIQKWPEFGLDVVGYLAHGPHPAKAAIHGVPVLGKSGELLEVLGQNKIDLLVISLGYEETSELMINLNRLFMNGFPLIDAPFLYENITGQVPIDYITEMWISFGNIANWKSYYRLVKRLIDLVVAAFCLLVTLPLFLLIPVAIRLDSGGPILFRQPRQGKDGRIFHILKFRTMTNNSGEGGPQWATVNDRRITTVGKILRKFHLDELPQLLNILKGEMSLIGPRPEWEVFAQQSQELVRFCRTGRRAGDSPYAQVLVGFKEKIPFYSYRLLVRPGITGWAQVMNPYAGSDLEDMQEKLRYDLYYIKNLGPLLDLMILIKTIRILIFGKGK